MVVKNPSSNRGLSIWSITSLMLAIRSGSNGTKNSPLNGSAAALTIFSTSNAVSSRTFSVVLTTASNVLTRFPANSLSLSFSASEVAMSVRSAMRRKNRGEDTTRIALETTRGSSWDGAARSLVIMSSMMDISAMVGSRLFPSRRLWLGMSSGVGVEWRVVVVGVDIRRGRVVERPANPDMSGRETSSMSAEMVSLRRIMVMGVAADTMLLFHSVSIQKQR
mmetsp:Transcript_12431/g.12523  ORF Transcript_12431/g.12523 Transcript_12431/m.12523 type:complete len:221 (-) Transcript_12431:13-675(-)